MAKPIYKNMKINKILSNGLCVVNARIYLNNGVANFAVTDFMNDSRLMLDFVNKKIVSNRDDIDMSAALIDELFDTIRAEIEVKK